MATKRPKCGINTRGRASCLGGKNKGFKAMLAQQQHVVDHKLEEKRQREKQLKAEKKQQALDLQKEYGMVDEAQVLARNSDSRRQQKMFLNSIFQQPENSIVYNDRRLFKTREAMQLYYQRRVDDVEWKDNLDGILVLKDKMSQNAVMRT